MIHGWTVPLVVAISVSAPAAYAAAQVPDDMLQRGLRAYADLDFDTAAQLLRDGLASASAGQIVPAEQARLLTHLAAAEVFRGDRDSAIAAFRRLAVLAPEYQVDELTFPPEVTALFAVVRLQIKAVRELLDRGTRAYSDLDFDAAAQLLRDGLASDSAGQITPAEQARLLTHLAAAEVFRGDRDSAIAAFRRLAVLEPEYHLDELTFPPTVTALFSVVRLQTEAVRELLDRGLRAYADLDFDAASWLLRRGLASGGAEQLEPVEHARILSYLAAAEFYRGDRDSAIAVFRRLAVRQPGHRVDELVFPPDVTALFTDVRGQTEAVRNLVDRGLRAYQNLDFATTAQLLRSALASNAVELLTPAEHARVLSHLGAAEVFRGDQNAAIAAFRTLAISHPRYRIDTLTFPPQVTSLFTAARGQVYAVGIDVPRTTTVRFGEEEFVFWLRATAAHEITAEVIHRDGRLIRALHTGPIVDSLQLRWDGRDSSGFLVWDGRDSSGVMVAPTGYFATVTSIFGGQLLRRVQVPFEVDVHRQDSLLHPARLPDSVFLRTRRESGPGIEALMGAVIGGVAITLLPSVFAPSTDLSATRFAVGGAVGLAGITGLITRFPGSPLRANIRSNDAIRREWQQRVDTVVRQNVARLTTPHLIIHSGLPVTTEMGRQ